MSETYIRLARDIPTIVHRDEPVPGTRLTASEAREYASRLLALADELDPADPPAKDELQAARDEYADAQESLSVEPSTEFGQTVVLQNALEAADSLLTALEAHAAAQQQRMNCVQA